MVALLLASLLVGCNEYVVQKQSPPDVVDPPDSEDSDDQGDAPNWMDCEEGYFGHYYNLTVDHPDVEPSEELLPVDDPEVFDWWDESRLSFERYDGSLDVGSNWWPVDDGLTSDPHYFAARWTAWIRVESAGDKTLVLGATSDAFVLVNNEVVADIQAASEFDPMELQVPLAAGQYPLEIRFAHRMGTAGLRARFAADDVVVCYPDFDD